jgi:hypothetical protein
MIPKIYQCLADDELRPVMCHAKVTKEETVASDAHILVVHSTADLFPADFITHIPEDGLYFGRSLLMDLSKPSAKNIEMVKLNDGPDLIRVTHELKHIHGVHRTYHEFKEVNASSRYYPDYNKVFPEKPSVVQFVNLKPSYLDRLMKAMASHEDTKQGYVNMKMKFYGDGNAIVCTPLSDRYPSCRGLIMPILENY